MQAVHLGIVTLERGRHLRPLPDDLVSEIGIDPRVQLWSIGAELVHRLGVEGQAFGDGGSEIGHWVETDRLALLELATGVYSLDVRPPATA